MMLKVKHTVQLLKGYQFQCSADKHEIKLLNVRHNKTFLFFIFLKLTIEKIAFS